MTEHPEDLPWNDVPADSDVVPGTEEPDPAEVVGDEDDGAVRDLTRPHTTEPADEYRRETLDQRLAEEEPDRTLGEPDQEAELLAPEPGEGDLDAPLAERDRTDPEEADVLPAEVDAVRVVDDERVR